MEWAYRKLIDNAKAMHERAAYELQIADRRRADLEETVKSQRAELDRLPATLTIHIPVQFKRRGGRKLVLAPDGVASPIAFKPAVGSSC
jgi:hypothetical protein